MGIKRVSWTKEELQRVRRARRRQWELAQMILNPIGSSRKLPKNPFGRKP